MSILRQGDAIFRRDVERKFTEVSSSLASLTDAFDDFVGSWSRAITVEDPSGDERIPLGFLATGVTVSRMVAVVSGGSPSVTWTIRFGADASGTGTELVSGGTTTTSTTSGSDVTTLTTDTIPDGQFLWLETTAQSGAVATLSVTILGAPIT